MPTIILYTDLSPNFAYAFATVMACGKDFAARNCFLPPPPPWGMGKMPSHQPLWMSTENRERKKNEFPPFWQRWFREVLRAARDGRDILLYGRESNPTRWKMFLDILRAQPELASHEIRGIAVMGRPACLLEQQARLLWPGKAVSPARWLALAREYARLADLAQLWRAELGAGHSILFADTSEQPVATGLSAGHRGALELMGLESFAPPAQSGHILSLASREARHFLFAAEVGSNAWPPLDTTRLAAHLRKMEREAGWDSRPISAPQYRAALEHCADNSLPQLENALQLEAGALAAPAELAAQNPWQAYSGFSDEAIGAFVDGLPHATARTLLQRYNQDCRLLGPGQKRIWQRLSESALQVGADCPPSSEQPLVSVLTLAWNQEAYIARCIESVLAQKTDFRVEHIVLDHCSSDKTPDIIRQYAQKYPSIRPVLLSQWLPGQNVRGLFSRCHSRYAALCDGDDYFTDPLKLQKQVNFLEAHPECGLCFHPVEVVYEDGSPSRVYPPEELLPGGIRKFYTIKDLLFANLIQTNSVVYRWRFTEGLPDWFDATLVPGDWYWHLLHAETGLIGYLREHMAVYRRHATSLYATAEGDHVTHRGVHGLNELRAYGVWNRHFHGRYYTDLQRLAMGVFVDFLQIYLRTGDDTLFEQGCSLCPDFARNFLAQLQISDNKPPMRL